jgi:hypothetical protein
MKAIDNDQDITRRLAFTGFQRASYSRMAVVVRPKNPIEFR